MQPSGRRAAFWPKTKPGPKTHFEYGQERVLHTHSSGPSGSKCGGKATGIAGFN